MTRRRMNIRPCGRRRRHGLAYGVPILRGDTYTEELTGEASATPKWQSQEEERNVEERLSVERQLRHKNAVA